MKSRKIPEFAYERTLPFFGDCVILRADGLESEFLSGISKGVMSLLADEN